MHWQQKIRYAVNSDLGCRRQNNEDNCGAQLAINEKVYNDRGHLFVVADGMGGHAVGELASKTVVDTIINTFHRPSDLNAKKALEHSIADANAEVNKIGDRNRDFQRMGTTCSSLVLSEEGAIVGHVGDSRVYRVRNDRTEQLTFDHSLQWELAKKTGRSLEEIEQEEPKNVITRCLGPETTIPIDIEGPHRIDPGDVYVLCSDGLTNYLDDREIGLIAKQLPAEEATELLINLACIRGGADNITAIVVQVAGEGASAAQAREQQKEQKILNEQRMQLARWIGLGCLVLGIIGGLIVTILVNEILGATLAIPTLIASIFLYLSIRKTAKRMRKGLIAVDDDDDGKIYRTADSRFSITFLDMLTKVGQRIYTVSQKEEWDIEQSEELKKNIVHAKKELEAKHPRRALLCWAKAIHYMLESRPTQDIKLTG